MRNWTFGAKALSIRPPATITPLKMVTGRAPKLSTQALHTGPTGKEARKTNRVEGREREKMSHREKNNIQGTKDRDNVMVLHLLYCGQQTEFQGKSHPISQGAAVSGDITATSR